uniref:Uncharacterized protein n=1 Tax=Suricata suricatta TaxID=37032 RepID=A0A673TZ06_SURSU
MSAGGGARKSTGRPSYYYRLLRRPRLQRQRSRSRSRTRPARESPQERPGSRRSLPGSLSEKSPSMEPSATTPFRVTVTISVSPSPPGLGCRSVTPRAPFLEPHGAGEHPTSLVLGIRSLSCSPLGGSQPGGHMGAPALREGTDRTDSHAAT